MVLTKSATTGFPMSNSFMRLPWSVSIFVSIVHQGLRGAYCNAHYRSVLWTNVVNWETASPKNEKSQRIALVIVGLLR